MYVKTLADTLAYPLLAMCYLMATRIYKETDKIQFRGILNGICVYTFNWKWNQL